MQTSERRNYGAFPDITVPCCSALKIGRAFATAK